MPARKSFKTKPSEPTELTPVYLTLEGIERLKAEHERLKHERPALAEETARAAAFGDRSENAEYQAAKRDLRRINNRIMRIDSELKRAVPIEAGTSADGKIRIGSIVTVEIIRGSRDNTNASIERRTYHIVGPRETNPAYNKISQESPLGAALIGKKLDGEIKLATPGGTQIYRVIEIK